MSHKHLVLVFILIIVFLRCSAYAGTDIRYDQTGQNSWNADSLGNHRFVIRLSEREYRRNTEAAIVTIPWRRRDRNPELKGVIITDAKSHTRVMNVLRGDINRESGTVVFEPVSGPGLYYVYYLLYKNEGRSNYPKGVYRVQDTTVSDRWRKSIGDWSKLPAAEAVEYQSIDPFNSFYPMELIATASETAALERTFAGSQMIIFPESRKYPVRMKNDLPLRWVSKGYSSVLRDTARRGEHFTFQLGIYARTNITGITVVFKDLKSAAGDVIPSSTMNCFNTEGVSYTGTTFQKKVSIVKGEIMSLWCGIEIPMSIRAGEYSGKVLMMSDGNPVQEAELRLTVLKTPAKDGGIDSPELMTRLQWLNSTIAQQNDVIAPYIPIAVKDSVVSLLGRELILGNDGLPSRIRTFFTEEMTSITDRPNELLSAPMEFHCTDVSTGRNVEWKNSGVTFTRREPGTVAWTAVKNSGSVRMVIRATLEFDGFLSYAVTLTALRDIVFSQTALQIPMRSESAEYVMGLGLKGGRLPDSVRWKWDVASKNQDGAWIGSVNAGLQFSLRDERYVRPLNTNFYLQKPLLLPSSWGNANNGGIDITRKGIAVTVNAYSGERRMKQGDSLQYDMTMLITPFHPIDTDLQWRMRFYHRFEDLDTIKAIGASVVNIHHATPVNPWINYPFIEWKKLRDYTDQAHTKGLKVKIYNTVRELSNRSFELFPLRSLGHEIFSPGKGGGFSWLQEHIGEDYIAAWFVPEIKDAAMVNSGMSRWHNYYVEGMNWLTKNVGIDGIYLDDVAFDRVTMKRIKRVLSQDGHPAIIDLHSANQYNKNDGFNNSANLYMEHFPYLTRLWFGEYFDYEKNSPDFYLTEVSGIPFGLMGEMLQDGGNPWRGMLYGMTNRMPWSDNADPRPLWKVWDEFGMEHSEMIGYWSRSCPVKTDDPAVLTTVYKKKGSAMISIASWADSTVNVRLSIDWNSLGIDPANAVISAPEIKNFQPAMKISLNEPISVPKGKGLMLIVR